MARFSEALMAHFSAPRNSGRLAAPDRRGVAGNPTSAPFLTLDLQLWDSQIADARFQTYGCGPAIACGSMLTVLIIGRSIAEARSLTAEDLIKALDGLPDDKRHCADLAINALRAALKDDVPA
jgi:nitrogen fixation NifU-like protein